LNLLSAVAAKDPSSRVDSRGLGLLIEGQKIEALPNFVPELFNGVEWPEPAGGFP
jgi:hypothetical protein